MQRNVNLQRWGVGVGKFRNVQDGKFSWYVSSRSVYASVCFVLFCPDVVLLKGSHQMGQINHHSCGM